MSLKSRVAGLVGLAFLALAALGPLYSAWMVVRIALHGVTAGSLMGVLFGAGLFVCCGLTGYFIRKTIAGQVIPIDVDRSVAYRGGQGGM